MIFIIIHTDLYQCTMRLQRNNNKVKRQEQLQTTMIPCGIEYLKETIGLSITNKHLYQFLLIDETIKIIRYDYHHKLLENNDNNDDYKLNLINGQMLSNGLADLISPDIVEQIMTIIHWTDYRIKNPNEQPILSIAMSMYKYGGYRIFCIKSFDKLTYQIGDYNQLIDYYKVETFDDINDQQKIMGIISNQNDGILLILYDKLSYSLVILKLKENYYANSKLEWTKSLLVDSNLNSLYEINENITEHENEQQQQELTKSFQQIFGPHTFTFGFVNDNRIYLFSNQDEKLISFAADFIQNTNFSYKKYPFNIQSYQDFFHCNKHNDPTTTTTTTAQQQHSSTTNDKHPTTITAESQNPMINNNNITRKSNHSITTTTTVPSIDEEQSTFPSMIIIIFISIMISILLIGIGLIIYYIIRKKSAQKLEAEFNKKFPLHRYRFEVLPKEQFNLDDEKLSSISSISPASTTSIAGLMSGKSIADSFLSTTKSTKMTGQFYPFSSTLFASTTSSSTSSTSSSSTSPTSSTTASTTMMSGKLLPYSSISPISTKISEVSEILFEENTKLKNKSPKNKNLQNTNLKNTIIKNASPKNTSPKNTNLKIKNLTPKITNLKIKNLSPKNINLKIKNKK